MWCVETISSLPTWDIPIIEAVLKIFLIYLRKYSFIG
jgi:hypothetical protein